MLFFARETFLLNNSTFASWWYFFTIKDDVVNYNWNCVNCIIWLTSSLKDISLSFEFSSYLLLCFWISSIITIFVVYCVFFFNVLRSFMNDRRILFSFFSSSIYCCRFSISFSFKYVSWNIKRDDFFSCA